MNITTEIRFFDILVSLRSSRDGPSPDSSPREKTVRHEGPAMGRRKAVVDTKESFGCILMILQPKLKCVYKQSGKVPHEVL